MIGGKLFRVIDDTFFASYADPVANYVASTTWLQEWPECRQLLLNRLPAVRQKPWLLALPGVCCQAVGGTPADAIPVAAAAATLLQAAYLLDAIQDGDDIAALELPAPAIATGLATGLIFAAYRFLSCVQSHPRAVCRLTALFSEAAFHASLGQYLDLSQDYASLTEIDALEAYWRTVKAKSGSIIRAAAAGGAAAGTDSERLIAALAQFGECLGVSLQVVDDCRDVLMNSPTGKREISLPVLLLSMAGESDLAVERQDDGRGGTPLSRETLLDVLGEADMTTIITDVLLEWRQCALNSLSPLDNSEAVATLESVWDRALSQKQVEDAPVCGWGASLLPFADSGKRRVCL